VKFGSQALQGFHFQFRKLPPAQLVGDLRQSSPVRPGTGNADPALQHPPPWRHHSPAPQHMSSWRHQAPWLQFRPLPPPPPPQHGHVTLRPLPPANTQHSLPPPPAQGLHWQRPPVEIRYRPLAPEDAFPSREPHSYHSPNLEY
jgi:hypothetical protein